MTRVCPSCGSSEIDEDSARGDSTCMSCGTVLEESAIVSELQFQERGGGHQIVGQFVGRDRGQPTSLSGVPGLSRNESRESTFLKGHKIIQRVSIFVKYSLSVHINILVLKQNKAFFK